MRVFLVRHGQSQANADWNTNKTVADHAIPLSEEGRKQPMAVGGFLSEWFENNLMLHGGTATMEVGGQKHTFDGPVVIPRIRLWHSPYRRTRETAQGIVSTCRFRFDHEVEVLGAEPMRRNTTQFDDDGVGEQFDTSWFFDSAKSEPVAHAREHLLLAEQQFGVFDGLSDSEREKEYAREQAYYEKCKKYEGKLWPKMPLGESRFEVCQRVHQAFGSFRRDAERHNIQNIVVVGHGTTNRAFVQMWMHKPWEWMHKEPNPKNCSVRLIEDGEDKGYIFKGFENPDGYKHTPNEAKEASE